MCSSSSLGANASYNSEKLDCLTVQESSASTKLDVHMEKISADVRTNTEKVIDAIAADSKAARQYYARSAEHQGKVKASHDVDMHKLIVDILESTRKVIDVIADSEAARQYSVQVGEHREMLRTEEEFRTKFLDSLYFSRMHTREGQIVDHHHETFRWIYHNDHYSRWSSLAHWLEQGTDTYWINGKAGSGKSTLMNYIRLEEATARSLELWAGSQKLFMPTFFFWNAGREEQRSALGLLRSLTYQILNSYPPFIRFITDDLLATRNTDFLQHNQIPTWTVKLLVKIVQTLICQTLLPLKLCFFIDGLDEFEGAQDDLLELLDTIKQYPNVKLCVASRPLPWLELAFGKSPRLRLQDLTHGDMIGFTSSTLLRVTQSYQLNLTSSVEISTIVDHIVGKADGVFLWVSLVVQDLVNGIKNGDTMTELLSRVDTMPSEIEHLYTKMLARLDKVYRRNTSLIFWLMVTTRQRDIPLLDFAAIEGEANLDNAESLSWFQEKHHSEWRSKLDILRSRVLARGAGLLQTITIDDAVARIHVDKTWWTSPDQSPILVVREPENLNCSTVDRNIRVTFSHRTARDYLIDTTEGRSFLDYSPQARVRAYLIHVKIALQRTILLWRNGHDTESHDSFREIVWYCRSADVLAEAAEPEAMETLERILIDLNLHADFHLDIGWEWPETENGKLLSNAVQYGLFEYLFWKLELSAAELTQALRTKVLMCIVRNYTELSATQPDCERAYQIKFCKTVRRLLSSGIDLDYEPAQDTSFFNTILQQFQSTMQQKSQGNARLSFASQDWASTLNIFQQYGAVHSMEKARNY